MKGLYIWVILGLWKTKWKLLHYNRECIEFRVTIVVALGTLLMDTVATRTRTDNRQ